MTRHEMPEPVRLQLAPYVLLEVLETSPSEPCALALSLYSGSHDEPVAWPGAAHFLEHMVFRGSRSFAADDGLMARVQRSGGKVNAQTAARHTLFHFETAAGHFLSCLERLADMLVYPLLEPDSLAGEREVLEQEYRMMARSPRVALGASVAAMLDGCHPLQRFLAGNKDTLPVTQPDFLPGLQAFHQRAYCRSPLHIVLSVSGAWADWQNAVLQALQPLLVQQRQPAVLPPPLLMHNQCARMLLQDAGQGLLLHIAFAEGGAGLPLVADWLQQAFAEQATGSFTGQVREHAGCTGVELSVPYRCGDQAVLTLHWQSCTLEQQPEILALLMAWLEQWLPWLESDAGRLYVEQAGRHRWSMASPLERVQQRLQSCTPDAARAGLRCLQASLRKGHCGWVEWGERPVQGRFDQGLLLCIERLQVAAAPAVLPRPVRFVVEPGLQQCLGQHRPVDDLPVTRVCPAGWPEDRALCYMGWPTADPRRALMAARQRLDERSRAWSWHGVGFQWQVMRDWLYLRLSGPADCLAAALADCRAWLQKDLPLQPDYPQSTASFALRQLLEQLPLQLAPPATGPWTGRLGSGGSRLLWLGGGAPGAGGSQTPAVCRSGAARTASEPVWRHVSKGINQVAEALLVVLIPATGPVQGLLFQLLAPLLQGPLQQQLRSRDGLCYAAFALPYHESDQGGLVLASQSSSVTSQVLLEALQQALDDALAGLQPCQLEDAVQDFRLALTQGRLPLESLGQWCFEAWQASGYLSLANTPESWLEWPDRPAIVAALQQVGDNRSWLVLSNQPGS